MLLGKLSVSGVLIWIIVVQGPLRLQLVRVGVVLTFFFSRLSFLFFLPLSGRRPK